ncbi:MAG: DUF2127 domain-containing protein [Jatrophihabitantaceae bacterium]
MDWNLRACSRSGHVTYAPDEPRLRERLTADTPLGAGWRCLRCGCYVLGEPHGSGPAEDAPVLLRGKALRSAFILRLLAIERFVRGLLILLLGIAVLQFKSSQVTVRQVFDRDLAAAKPLFDQLGWNATDSGLIHSVESALNARGSTLDLVAAFLLFYGMLQLIEGVGLWLLKRWGEYFAVVATSLFLPLEIYELTEKVTVLRAVAFIVNLAAVAYLLLSKRLFGLRGGHRAYQAEQHEASLLEVEQSADRLPEFEAEAEFKAELRPEL